MVVFNIKIVSDNVCPWCYVGKKKLEAAISLYHQRHPFSSDTFSTTWSPFYLNPDAPTTGIDKTAYYASKFGAAQTQQIYSRLSAVGSSVGISFKFGGKTGNTRDSHRLVQLGKTKSPALQTRVVEELFATYFEREGDITSRDVLQEAGERAGLDKGEVKEWLASDQGGKEVDQEVREAREEAVSGVPNFSVNGVYEVSGAQDPDVFVRLFEKIKGMEKI